MPFMNDEMIPVRVFDHGHPADWGGKNINYECYLFLLQGIHEGIEIRNLKSDYGAFSPRGVAHVGGGDGKG